MRDKKGIVRIIEAVIAILIVLGAILVVSLNKRQVNNVDLSEQINPLLDQIAQNVSLRDKILSNSAEAKVEIMGFLNGKIENPSFNYSVNICNLEESCGLDAFPGSVNTEIYSYERVISASISNPNVESKRVKIFLWRIG
jgi:hypothetical protein